MTHPFGQLAQMTPEQVAELPPAEFARLVALVDAEQSHFDRTKIDRLFPDEGPLRRELYTKHVEFFAAGATYDQRAFIAANRVGKSLAVCFELVHHLTGQYPNWWEGRRFNRAITAWAAGEDTKAVRESLQETLLGKVGEFGTGLIPADRIVSVAMRSGVPEAVDSVTIKNISGSNSRLVFKTYDQGRESFQASKVDVVLFDEEPPISIYTEGATRTMSTVPGQPNGLVMCAFTPLKGLSGVVLSFMPGGQTPKEGQQQEHKYVVFATWSHVPHLSEASKAALESAYLPHERAARTKGVPSLGAGAIYPIDEDEILIDPFEFPVWYKHAYALDVGWRRTAVLWGALDPESDVLYLYAEHYRAEAEPPVHAAAINARGKWVPGVIDPAARNRSPADGLKLMNSYRDELGLDLTPADNSVYAGLHEVWMRLTTGRLKVFRSMQYFMQEFRIYRRDEKGNIVKENDHLLDDLRYLVMSGIARARVRPHEEWAGRPGMPNHANRRHKADFDPFPDLNPSDPSMHRS